MKTVSELLAPLVADRRLGPVHVCLYLAIWQCAERRVTGGWAMIRREELMWLAKISGKTTYYRLMRDLERYGYVKYKPSMDSEGRSKVRVCEGGAVGSAGGILEGKGVRMGEINTITSKPIRKPT